MEAETTNENRINVTSSTKTMAEIKTKPAEEPYDREKAGPKTITKTRFLAETETRTELEIQTLRRLSLRPTL